MDVVLRLVGLFVERSHPALAPEGDVAPVVVVPGRRDRDLVELGKEEHGSGRGVAAAGVAVDADPLQIERWIAGAELLDANYVISQAAGLAEVDAVGDIVEG